LLSKREPWFVAAPLRREGAAVERCGRDAREVRRTEIEMEIFVPGAPVWAEGESRGFVVEFVRMTAVLRRQDAPVFDLFNERRRLRNYERRRTDFGKRRPQRDAKRLSPTNFEGRF